VPKSKLIKVNLAFPPTPGLRHTHRDISGLSQLKPWPGSLFDNDSFWVSVLMKLVGKRCIFISDLLASEAKLVRWVLFW